MQLERDIADFRNLSARMGDLVLGLLVFELEDTPRGGGQSAIERKRGLFALQGIVPAGVNSLALRALLELLHGDRPNVFQVVSAGIRDNAIPDDGRVGRILAWCARPLGRDVYEELLGVPREERRQIGVEGEFDDGILFLFGRVVVRPTLDAVGFPQSASLPLTHPTIAEGSRRTLGYFVG